MTCRTCLVLLFFVLIFGVHWQPCTSGVVKATGSAQASGPNVRIEMVSPRPREGTPQTPNCYGLKTNECGPCANVSFSRIPTQYFDSKQPIEVTMWESQDQNGNSDFRICDISKGKAMTESCFDGNILEILTSEIKGNIMGGVIKSVLLEPPVKMCDHCVLQWSKYIQEDDCKLCLPKLLSRTCADIVLLNFDYSDISHHSKNIASNRIPSYIFSSHTQIESPMEAMKMITKSPKNYFPKNNRRIIDFSLVDSMKASKADNVEKIRPQEDPTQKHKLSSKNTEHNFRIIPEKMTQKTNDEENELRDIFSTQVNDFVLLSNNKNFKELQTNNAPKYNVGNPTVSNINTEVPEDSLPKGQGRRLHYDKVNTGPAPQKSNINWEHENWEYAEDWQQQSYKSNRNNLESKHMSQTRANDLKNQVETFIKKYSVSDESDPYYVDKFYDFLQDSEQYVAKYANENEATIAKSLRKLPREKLKILMKSSALKNRRNEDRYLDLTGDEIERYSHGSQEEKNYYFGKTSKMSAVEKYVGKYLLSHETDPYYRKKMNELMDKSETTVKMRMNILRESIADDLKILFNSPTFHRKASRNRGSSEESGETRDYRVWSYHDQNERFFENFIGKYSVENDEYYRHKLRKLFDSSEEFIATNKLNAEEQEDVRDAMAYEISLLMMSAGIRRSMKKFRDYDNNYKNNQFRSRRQHGSGGSSEESGESYVSRYNRNEDDEYYRRKAAFLSDSSEEKIYGSGSSEESGRYREKMRQRQEWQNREEWKRENWEESEWWKKEEWEMEEWELEQWHKWEMEWKWWRNGEWRKYGEKSLDWENNPKLVMIKKLLGSKSGKKIINKENGEYWSNTRENLRKHLQSEVISDQKYNEKDQYYINKNKLNSHEDERRIGFENEENWWYQNKWQQNNAFDNEIIWGNEDDRHLQAVTEKNKHNTINKKIESSLNHMENKKAVINTSDRQTQNYNNFTNDHKAWTHTETSKTVTTSDGSWQQNKTVIDRRLNPDGTWSTKSNFIQKGPGLNKTNSLKDNSGSDANWRYTANDSNIISSPTLSPNENFQHNTGISKTHTHAKHVNQPYNVLPNQGNNIVQGQNENLRSSQLSKTWWQNYFKSKTIATQPIFIHEPTEPIAINQVFQETPNDIGSETIWIAPQIPFLKGDITTQQTSLSQKFFVTEIKDVHDGKTTQIVTKVPEWVNTIGDFKTFVSASRPNTLSSINSIGTEKLYLPPEMTKLLSGKNENKLTPGLEMLDPLLLASRFPDKKVLSYIENVPQTNILAEKYTFNDLKDKEFLYPEMTQSGTTMSLNSLFNKTSNTEPIPYTDNLLSDSLSMLNEISSTKNNFDNTNKSNIHEIIDTTSGAKIDLVAKHSQIKPSSLLPEIQTETNVTKTVQTVSTNDVITKIIKGEQSLTNVGSLPVVDKSIKTTETKIMSPVEPNNSEVYASTLEKRTNEKIKQIFDNSVLEHTVKTVITDNGKKITNTTSLVMTSDGLNQPTVITNTKLTETNTLTSLNQNKQLPTKGNEKEIDIKTNIMPQMNSVFDHQVPETYFPELMKNIDNNKNTTLSEIIQTGLYRQTDLNAQTAPSDNDATTETETNSVFETETLPVAGTGNNITPLVLKTKETIKKIITTNNTSIKTDITSLPRENDALDLDNTVNLANENSAQTNYQQFNIMPDLSSSTGTFVSEQESTNADKQSPSDIFDLNVNTGDYKPYLPPNNVNQPNTEYVEPSTENIWLEHGTGAPLFTDDFFGDQSNVALINPESDNNKIDQSSDYEKVKNVDKNTLPQLNQEFDNQFPDEIMYPDFNGNKVLNTTIMSTENKSLTGANMPIINKEKGLMPDTYLTRNAALDLDNTANSATANSEQNNYLNQISDLSSNTATVFSEQESKNAFKQSPLDIFDLNDNSDVSGPTQPLSDMDQSNTEYVEPSTENIWLEHGTGAPLFTDDFFGDQSNVALINPESDNKIDQTKGYEKVTNTDMNLLPQINQEFDNQFPNEIPGIVSPVVSDNLKAQKNYNVLSRNEDIGNSLPSLPSTTNDHKAINSIYSENDLASEPNNDVSETTPRNILSLDINRPPLNKEIKDVLGNHVKEAKSGTAVEETQALLQKEVLPQINSILHQDRGDKSKPFIANNIVTNSIKTSISENNKPDIYKQTKSTTQIAPSDNMASDFGDKEAGGTETNPLLETNTLLVTDTTDKVTPLVLKSKETTKKIITTNNRSIKTDIANLPMDSDVLDLENTVNLASANSEQNSYLQQLNQTPDLSKNTPNFVTEKESTKEDKQSPLEIFDLRIDNDVPKPNLPLNNVNKSKTGYVEPSTENMWLEDGTGAPLFTDDFFGDQSNVAVINSESDNNVIDQTNTFVLPINQEVTNAILKNNSGIYVDGVLTLNPKTDISTVQGIITQATGGFINVEPLQNQQTDLSNDTDSDYGTSMPKYMNTDVLGTGEIESYPFDFTPTHHVSQGTKNNVQENININFGSEQIDLPTGENVLSADSDGRDLSKNLIGVFDKETHLTKTHAIEAIKAPTGSVTTLDNKAKDSASTVTENIISQTSNLMQDTADLNRSEKSSTGQEDFKFPGHDITIANNINYTVKDSTPNSFGNQESTVFANLSPIEEDYRKDSTERSKNQLSDLTLAPSSVNIPANSILPLTPVFTRTDLYHPEQLLLPSDKTSILSDVGTVGKQAIVQTYNDRTVSEKNVKPQLSFDINNSKTLLKQPSKKNSLLTIIKRKWRVDSEGSSKFSDLPENLPKWLKELIIKRRNLLLQTRAHNYQSENEFDTYNEPQSELAIKNKNGKDNVADLLVILKQLQMRTTKEAVHMKTQHKKTLKHKFGGLDIPVLQAPNFIHLVQEIENEISEMSTDSNKVANININRNEINHIRSVIEKTKQNIVDYIISYAQTNGHSNDLQNKKLNLYKIYIPVPAEFLSILSKEQMDKNGIKNLNLIEKNNFNQYKNPFLANVYNPQNLEKTEPEEHQTSNQFAIADIPSASKVGSSHFYPKKYSGYDATAINYHLNKEPHRSKDILYSDQPFYSPYIDSKTDHVHIKNNNPKRLVNVVTLKQVNGMLNDGNRNSETLVEPKHKNKINERITVGFVEDLSNKYGFNTQSAIDGFRLVESQSLQNGVNNNHFSTKSNINQAFKRSSPTVTMPSQKILSKNINYFPLQNQDNNWLSNNEANSIIERLKNHGIHVPPGLFLTPNNRRKRSVSSVAAPQTQGLGTWVNSILSSAAHESDFYLPSSFQKLSPRAEEAKKPPPQKRKPKDYFALEDTVLNSPVSLSSFTNMNGFDYSIKTDEKSPIVLAKDENQFSLNTNSPGMNFDDGLISAPFSDDVSVVESKNQDSDIKPTDEPSFYNPLFHLDSLDDTSYVQSSGNQQLDINSQLTNKQKQVLLKSMTVLAARDSKDICTNNRHLGCAGDEGFLSNLKCINRCVHDINECNFDDCQCACVYATMGFTDESIYADNLESFDDELDTSTLQPTTLSFQIENMQKTTLKPELSEFRAVNQPSLKDQLLAHRETFQKLMEEQNELIKQEEEKKKLEYERELKAQQEEEMKIKRRKQQERQNSWKASTNEKEIKQEQNNKKTLENVKQEIDNIKENSQHIEHSSYNVNNEHNYNTEGMLSRMLTNSFLSQLPQHEKDSNSVKYDSTTPMVKTIDTYNVKDSEDNASRKKAIEERRKRILLARKEARLRRMRINAKRNHQIATPSIVTTQNPIKIQNLNLKDNSVKHILRTVLDTTQKPVSITNHHLKEIIIKPKVNTEATTIKLTTTKKPKHLHSVMKQTPRNHPRMQIQKPDFSKKEISTKPGIDIVTEKPIMKNTTQAKKTEFKCFANKLYKHVSGMNDWCKTTCGPSNNIDCAPAQCNCGYF